MTDMNELLEKFFDGNNMYSFEGRRGVEHLAKVAEAVGYKDPNYYGQLNNGASIGSLIMFLEDNPGAIAAVFGWISDINSPEMREHLSQQVQLEEGDDEDGDDDES